METKAAKIRLNNQTDFSFIEQFQESDENGNPVPAPVPEDSIDFEIEFFADNGVRFKVSRRNGIYDHCEKLDDNRLCVYVPLSKCFLGSGWLCQKLWISLPDAFWNNTARNICIPSCPGIWLWNGPSDDVKASAEIEAFIGTVYRGKDGVTPHIGENGNWWIGNQDTGCRAEPIHFGPRELFPETGIAGTLYIDTANERAYRWDEAAAVYRCVGWGIDSSDEIILSAQDEA